MNAARADHAKPLPALTGLAGEFYRWCAQGELRFQRCEDCIDIGTGHGTRFLDTASHLVGIYIAVGLCLGVKF